METSGGEVESFGGNISSKSFFTFNKQQREFHLWDGGEMYTIFLYRFLLRLLRRLHMEFLRGNWNLRLIFVFTFWKHAHKTFFKSIITISRPLRGESTRTASIDCGESMIRKNLKFWQFTKVDGDYIHLLQLWIHCKILSILCITNYTKNSFPGQLTIQYLHDRKNIQLQIFQTPKFSW